MPHYILLFCVITFINHIRFTDRHGYTLLDRDKRSELIKYHYSGDVENMENLHFNTLIRAKQECLHVLICSQTQIITRWSQNWRRSVNQLYLTDPLHRDSERGSGLVECTT